jgi:N-acetylglucosaminyldiphosphoundecaprenol N-acetyl-beta-D-mannosaminyltransferase
MTSDQPIALMGVIAEGGTTDEIIQKIQILIDEYHKDLHPRYVATANVNFLVQVNSCISFDSPHPELMHILREAKIVTIDGMPLVWLSNLLGSPVKQRVAGIDLLPKLADALSQKNQSLFLLGGQEKTLKLCILYLQALNPNVRIVGALHPKIYTEGEIQENNDERDYLLAEQINRAAPDVLFINLGNPKQEIWFERIRNKLRVPVSIGVGGSFDLLTGMIPRAPVWMQKYGLEWLFRLYQEPKRLFKRYIIDLIKFPLLAIPLIIYHQLNNFFSWLGSPKKEKIILRNSLLFLSAKQTIAALPLPRRLTAIIAAELKTQLDDLFSQDGVIVDFKETTHIDLEGLAFLIMLWKKAKREKKPLYALNMSSRIRWLFRFHRLWDYISLYVCNRVSEALIRFSKGDSEACFYDAIQQNHNFAVVSFFGRLDHQIDFENYLKKVNHILFQKECIFDLSYCTYIDNAGIAFLLKLKKNKPQLFVHMKLHGIPHQIEKQLRDANVLHLFEIAPNLEAVFS